MELICPKKRSFEMRNLTALGLRRNLRRVSKKSEWAGVDIEATLQDGKTVETFTSGTILDGRLIGYGYHGPKQARICDIKIPVSEIVQLKVSYDPRTLMISGEPERQELA